MRVEDMMDHEVNEVRKAFHYFDRSNLGTITTDRLGDCLRWLKLVPSEAEISAFSIAADPKGVGTIDFDTFLAVAAQFWIPDLQQREAQSWAAFLCFDKLDKGKLSVENIKTILTETSDEPLPEKEVNQIIKKFVDKKDGMIEYGYMIRAWQK
ncbi:Calmodulin [Taenia crassiceps]|uniref:Calmodulin n=1 Tax=Taenia crassiceps TaxID=6207 RepID=A0ABR4QRP7_9CEST